MAAHLDKFELFKGFTTDPCDVNMHIWNNLTEKSKALNKVTKCNTMMVQDSFLGSLLALPVELSKGIIG